MFATKSIIQRNSLKTAAANTNLAFARIRSSSYTSSSNAENPAGAGYGNVHDQMLPPSQEECNRMFKHTQRPKTVSVIGAPMTFGQPYSGTDFGPQLLRQEGLLESLKSIGWRIHDHGDLDFKQISQNSDNYSAEMPGAKNSTIVGKGCEMVAHAVAESMKNNQFPLILGGDHSIGAGTLAGLLSVNPNTGVIWVDAHADLNTPTLSESGNMHGMPVGLMMKGIAQDPSKIPGFEWMGNPNMSNRLDPDSIVYIGLRDIDLAERRILREKNIKVFTMYDVDNLGIGKVMESAIGHLLTKDPNRPLHVSYDIDACDPIEAPATGTAVRGGLTYREAHFVAEAVARSGSLASAEIVELNPTLSDDNGSKETVELGHGILTSLMGKTII